MSSVIVVMSQPAFPARTCDGCAWGALCTLHADDGRGLCVYPPLTGRSDDWGQIGVLAVSGSRVFYVDPVLPRPAQDSLVIAGSESRLYLIT